MDGSCALRRLGKKCRAGEEGPLIARHHTFFCVQFSDGAKTFSNTTDFVYYDSFSDDTARSHPDNCPALRFSLSSSVSLQDLYNEKRLSQVARCLFSLSEVARRTMPDFPGPHLSAPDRPEVDPAVKAVVDIAKGNTPTPPWATKAPTPVTPRKMAGSADGFNAAGKSHTVHSGSVLGTPSRSVHLTLPNREKFTAAYEPGCSLSPAAHAAGQLTYGIYEGGGGCSTPLAVPTESFFVAGRTHVDSNDCTPHRSRDGAGCSNGADGHQTDTNTGKVLRRALSREEELRRRKQAVARVDAEMEVALWIEGVTGVTFPGKFWSSLKDGGKGRTSVERGVN